MPVEIKGQQLRIRIKDPKKYSKFRTDDVGETGKLQRIAGYSNGKWETQAWKINISDYVNIDEAESDLRAIKGLPSKKKKQALKLLKKYMG